MSTIENIQVYCGETGRDLTIPLLDSFGQPINIGGAEVRLQGHSTELPSLDLDVAGTVFDASSGKARWVGIGDESVYVSQADDLGELPMATYSCQVKATIGGKVIFSPTFTIQWLKRILA